MSFATDESPSFVEDGSPSLPVAIGKRSPLLEYPTIGSEGDGPARGNELSHPRTRQLGDEMAGPALHTREEGTIRAQARVPHHRPAGDAGFTQQIVGELPEEFLTLCLRVPHPG